MKDVKTDREITLHSNIEQMRWTDIQTIASMYAATADMCADFYFYYVYGYNFEFDFYF